ncbi:MAG TPA: hypothetical protein VFT78_01190 [Hanamia sp.]|jgi:hypothetical protein|nr:hypothetical protein [Hanamia sp.]
MRSKSLFTLLLCAAIFSTAHSQSLKLWTWNSYNMRFKIPDNMSIVYNDNTRFEATNQVITIDIYPRKGEDLTYSGMKNAIVAWAQQEQLRYNYYNKYNNEQPIYLKDLNRYWGCAIDGTKGGNPATMLLLVNPDNPDISLYVWIAYNDDYYQDVMQILESFEPM